MFLVWRTKEDLNVVSHLAHQCKEEGGRVVQYKFLVSVFLFTTWRSEFVRIPKNNSRILESARVIAQAVPAAAN
jgi:hypothetical protein